MIHPINHLPPVIKVGIQTESGVEAIGFDLSPWVARWPDLAFAVWPTRPGERASYIAADTELVGNVLYWYPNAADTEKEGAGTVEVVGIGGGKCKSSGVIDTLVKKTSLDVTQETPEPMKLWAEKVLQAADSIMTKVDVVDGGLLVVLQKKAIIDHTYDEIDKAVNDGKACLLVDREGRVYVYSNKKANTEDLVFRAIDYGVPTGVTSYTSISQYEAHVTKDNKFSVVSISPVSTPNPKKLILTGAVEAEYDGSKEIKIEIPKGSAEPEEVVYIKETALTHDDEMWLMMSPWEVDVEAGKMYKVTYNGTQYECEAMYVPAMGACFLGNLSIADATGGNTDAPFLLIAATNQHGAAEGVYGMLLASDNPDSVTVSVTGRKADESPFFEVRVPISYDAQSVLQYGDANKMFAQVEAAYKAGKIIRVVGVMQESGITQESYGDVRVVMSASNSMAFCFEMYTNMFLQTSAVGRIVRMMTEGEGGKIAFTIPN